MHGVIQFCWTLQGKARKEAWSQTVILYTYSRASDWLQIYWVYWVSDPLLSLGGLKEGRVEAGRPVRPVWPLGRRGRVKIRAVEGGGEGKRRQELVLGTHPDTKSRTTW